MARDGKSLEVNLSLLNIDEIGETLQDFSERVARWQPSFAVEERHRRYYTSNVREISREIVPLAHEPHGAALQRMNEEIDRVHRDMFDALVMNFHPERYTRIEYGLDHVIDQEFLVTWDPPSAEANDRALKLLRENLSPEQLKMFDECRYFEVVGGETGNHYRVFTSSRTFNIAEITSDGKNMIGRLCIVPPASMRLPIYDIALAQKLALELYELETLVKANYIESPTQTPWVS